MSWISKEVESQDLTPSRSLSYLPVPRGDEIVVPPPPSAMSVLSITQFDGYTFNRYLFSDSDWTHFIQFTWDHRLWPPLPSAGRICELLHHHFDCRFQLRGLRCSD